MESIGELIFDRLAGLQAYVEDEQHLFDERRTGVKAKIFVLTDTETAYIIYTDGTKLDLYWPNNR